MEFETNGWYKYCYVLHKLFSFYNTFNILNTHVEWFPSSAANQVDCRFGDEILLVFCQLIGLLNRWIPCSLYCWRRFLYPFFPVLLDIVLVAFIHQFLFCLENHLLRGFNQNGRHCAPVHAMNHLNLIQSVLMLYYIISKCYISGVAPNLNTLCLFSRLKMDASMPTIHKVSHCNFKWRTWNSLKILQRFFFKSCWIFESTMNLFKALWDLRFFDSWVISKSLIITNHLAIYSLSALCYI